MATVTIRKGLQSLGGADAAFEECEVEAVLTSADILDIANTPIELVAGVAGKTFLPIAAFALYEFVTTAYTISTAEADLLVGNAVGSLLALRQTGLIDADWDMWGIFGTLVEVTGAAFAAGDVTGQPLTLGTASLSPTLGDGTLTVTVLYRVVDV